MAELDECMDVAIPKEAEEIKVTSIINPYHIRIHQVNRKDAHKDELCRLLQKIIKKKNKRPSSSTYIPKTDDNVIVSNNELETQIDLPNWSCRGIITDCTSKTSDVFLVDYGITINVPNQSLVKYRPSAIPFEPLTETVSMYNIIPVDTNLCVLSDWPVSTVNFIKELFQVAKKIYFNVITCDKMKNKKYGDFYLIIEKRNICISKTLTYSSLAVPFCTELKIAINSDNKEQKMAISYQLGKKKMTTNSITEKPSNNLSKRKTLLKKKQLNQEKMLIQSDYLCEPLKDLADARFTAVVHKALENNGVRVPKQIQSYLWPAVKQGLNAVAISPKASGKTIGYLVPMISNLTGQEESILEKQKECTVTKPVVLILCATTDDCVQVTVRCKELLYNHDSIKAFAAYNGLNEKTIMTNICNKFHILVSTPPFLKRMLEKFSKKLIFSELSCLILDHADDLLEKYENELIDLIKSYKIIDTKRQNLLYNGPMQIVTVSQCWTEKLRDFVENCKLSFNNEPYICIGSFTEAAAYCNVQGRMMICRSVEKNQIVSNMIKDYNQNKTMVLCINSDEAIELNDFLKSKSVKTVLVHENIPIAKIEEIRNDWNKCVSGVYPLVICTDEVVFELEISNIQFLIHYTVTNVSKTAFNRRFSVLMDNWIKEQKDKCRMLILFDETKENMHFKGVVNILKRLKVDLPNDWQNIADGLDLMNDMKKKNHSLCESIKLFGSCKDVSCSDRHSVIADVDIPKSEISIGDELKLHVIYVHSASNFSVRVLECIKTCNETGRKQVITFPYNIIQFQSQMKAFYSKQSNRIMEKDIEVGKICAKRDTEGCFSRVEVTKIVETNIRTNKPSIVKVRCVDDGKVYDKIYAHDLYQMPQNLVDFKFPIYEVYMTGIAPFDEERKWTELASLDTQKWFKDFCNTTSFPYAKVLLQIGNCIWTDTIVARSKLIGYADLVASSLKNFMLDNQHGTENENHLSNLVSLCHKGNLTEVNGKPIKLPNKKVAPIDDCD